MAESSVTTSFNADVSKLRAQAAVAVASLRAATAEMNTVARAAQAAGQSLDGNLSPELVKSSATVAALESRLASLRSQMKNVASESSHTGTMLGSNRATFLELGHSARAMADSLAAGADPLRVLAQEAPRVTQALIEMNGVSLTTIARYGGIAAAAISAGAALMYFNSRAKEAEQAADLSAKFSATGTPLPTSKIEEYTAYLREAGWTTEQLKNITAANVQEITERFQGLRDASPQLTEALMHALPDLANLMREEPVAAAKSLSEALDNLGGKGQELLDKLHPAPDVMTKFQESLEKNPAQAQAIFLDQLQGALTRYSTSLDASRNTARTWGESIQDALGALSGTGPMDDAAITQDHLAQALERSATAARELAAANIATQGQNRAPDTEAIRSALDKMAEDTSKTHAQIVAEQQAYVGKILSSAKMEYTERAALQRQFETLTTAMQVTAGERAIDEARLQAERAAAAAGPSRAAQVRAEIATYQQTLDTAKLTADQKLSLNNTIAELQVQLIRREASESKKSTTEEWQNFSTAMQGKIADARGNFAQQIDLARQWVAEGQALYGQDISHYRNALEEKSRIQREQIAEQLTIERQNFEAQKQLSEIDGKATPGEFKVGLNLVLNPGQLAEQVQQQIAAARESAEAELKLLADEMQAALNNNNAPGYNQASNQSLEVQARLAQQIQEIQQRAADATAASWEKAMEPIASAFNTQIDAMMRGTESLRQAIGKVGASVIADFAHMAEQSAEKWVIAEIVKTGATQTGAASREAIASTESGGLFSTIGGMLARWFGMETAKTAATTAGVATRTTETAAGAAAGAAAEKTAGATTVLGAAYKAAAGAYASVAQIPVVGWLLAPAAAAVAFGAVMAFDSFDKGSYELPNDMIAQVHKGEMIVPAAQASDIRAMLGGTVSPAAGFPDMVGAMSRPAALGGLRGSIGANISSAINITHAPSYSFTGTAISPADVERASKMSHRQLNTMLRDRFSNGALKLPGRG